MSWSAHREPAPAPQPSTVVAEPATPQACAQDYGSRNTDTPQQVTAPLHTYGRKS